MRPYLSQENDQNLYNNLLFKLALSQENKINQVIGLTSKKDGKNVNNNVRIKDRNSFKKSFEKGE